MLEQIIAKQAAMNEQIKALREEAGALVKPMLQEFIKTYPEVKQIKWTQYTPYFNDGDTCTFSIHDFGFFFEGDDLDDSYYDHEIYGDKTDQACSVETWEACKKLEADLNSIEDALHDLFGDHVEVIVKPDGVEVEEHEHD